MTLTSASVAIVVLAGGKSSRMGVDKRGLIVGGQTLLARACALGEATLVSTGREGQVVISGSDLEPCRFRTVPDRALGRGPLEAMASVMEALAGAVSAFIFLPVDMPLLCASDLQRLMHSDAPACCFSGYELPLWLSANTAPHVEAAANGSRRSIRSLLELLQPALLEPPPERHMLNTNTPEDWSQL